MHRWSTKQYLAEVMEAAAGRLPRLFLGLIALTTLGIQPPANAQTYPAKPIRMLVGLAAGGSTDITARLVAQKMSESLGQPMLVENVTGAAGQLAVQRLLSMPADGYTLIMIAASATVHPALNRKLPYDLERDLTPISLVTIGSYVMVVNPAVKARSVAELLALMRAQPNKLTYGSDGVGSALHLSGELLKMLANVQIVHVPYKGGSESAAANAAGQIDMSFVSIGSALPFMNSGRLIPLAMTHDKRSTLMPTIPTLEESGVQGYDRLGWYGLMAKAGVSRDIIMKLNSVVVAVANHPEIKSTLQKQGLEPQTNTPEEFAAFIRKEIDVNGKLVKAAGITPE